jgi:hypothetical protein
MEKKIKIEEINKRFSQYETSIKLPATIVVLTFLAGMLLMSYKFYLTKGLSSIDFLLENPNYEFKVVALDTLSLLLIIGSMFASIIIFSLYERVKYFKIAKENCIKYVLEEKNIISVDSLNKKINEEIKWVRDNI